MRIVSVVVVVLLVGVASATRPKGVRVELASLYNPAADFSCLDGSGTIPFIQVNDDYCDCDDGSDEPGTSACPEGKFYCENKGHKSRIIPSSRVKDGICDCCDGSDEWESGSVCEDVCMELGREAREAAEAEMKVTMEGYNIKLGMIQEGNSQQEQRLAEISEKESRKAELEAVKEAKQREKEEAERPEKEALDYYKQLEEEERRKKEEAEKAAEDAEAERFFTQLDTDGDGTVGVAELQKLPPIDTNKDGEVNEEEAKFFLSGAESFTLDTFKETGYKLLKPYLEEPAPATPEVEEEDDDDQLNLIKPPPVGQEMVPPGSGGEEAAAGGEKAPETPEVYDPWRANQQKDVEGDGEIDDYDEAGDEKDEEEEEEDYDATDPQRIISSGTPDDTEKAEDKYDPKTRELIASAEAARRAFDDAEREFKETEREINHIKDLMEKDYGSENEFSVLAKQCFEYTDHEYVYKLCLFDHTSQKSKNGGSETRLGSWGEWRGPEHNRYAQMKFTSGQQCWNGPARSTLVHLRCGRENILTAVSEPNRCEYEMHFTTPAACSKPTKPHDEL